MCSLLHPKKNQDTNLLFKSDPVWIKYEESRHPHVTCEVIYSTSFHFASLILASNLATDLNPPVLLGDPLPTWCSGGVKPSPPWKTGAFHVPIWLYKWVLFLGRWWLRWLGSCYYGTHSPPTMCSLHFRHVVLYPSSNLLAPPLHNTGPLRSFTKPGSPITILNMIF